MDAQTKRYLRSHDIEIDADLDEDLELNDGAADDAAFERRRKQNNPPPATDRRQQQKAWGRAQAKRWRNHPKNRN